MSDFLSTEQLVGMTSKLKRQMTLMANRRRLPISKLVSNIDLTRDLT
jgi:hypothetical protein